MEVLPGQGSGLAPTAPRSSDAGGISPEWSREVDNIVKVSVWSFVPVTAQVRLQRGPGGFPAPEQHPGLCLLPSLCSEAAHEVLIPFLQQVILH